MGEGRTSQKEVAKQAVRKLWLKYKYCPIESITNGGPLTQRRVFSSEINDYFVGGFAQTTPTNDRDEYDDWLARAGYPEDVRCTDPIAYW